MSGETAVYRFYDTDGHLLYVGITSDPWKRFAKHEYAAWAESADLRRTRVRWYRTRRAAKRAETRAIKTEYPAYNLAESTGRLRPVQPTLPADCNVLDPCEVHRRRDRDWFTLRWNAGRRHRSGRVLPPAAVGGDSDAAA